MNIYVERIVTEPDYNAKYEIFKEGEVEEREAAEYRESRRPNR